MMPAPLAEALANPACSRTIFDFASGAIVAPCATCDHIAFSHGKDGCMVCADIRDIAEKWAARG